MRANHDELNETRRLCVYGRIKRQAATWAAFFYNLYADGKLPFVPDRLPGEGSAFFWILENGGFRRQRHANISKSIDEVLKQRRVSDG